MKKIVYTSLLLFLFISSKENLYAQSGWFWQNPLPVGNSLRSCKITESNTVYIISDKESILKSTNGGANWLVLKTNTNTQFNSLSFINSTTGYVVGEEGKILKTTNGGQSWVSQKSSLLLGLNEIFFININTGWICGDSAKILYTSNGGNNWFHQSNPTNLNLISIFFTNNSTGWCTTSGKYILKTINSGINWSLQSISYISYINNFKKIQFINNETGWCIGDIAMYPQYYSKIVKTTDGGISWFLPSGTSWFYAIDFYFSDSHTGWVVGDNIRSKTTNGGDSWVTQTGYMNNGVYFLNNNTGVIACSFGNILLTSNGGNNWTNIKSSFTDKYLYDVHFFNSNTGLISANDGLLYETINGGITWSVKSQITGVGVYLHSMDFLNDNTGWVIGSSGRGQVYYTTNRGTLWADISVGDIGGNYINSTCIKFINNSTGIVGAYYGSGLRQGTIYRTTNNGNNWNQVFSIGNNYHNNYLRSVYFVDQQTGWMVGGDGGQAIILKTTNTGINWNITNPNGNLVMDLHKVIFINSMTGWIFGRGGISKTINAGQEWITQLNLDFTQIFNSGFFINETTGWTVNNHGNIFKTTNGGTNWFEQISLSRSEATSVFFINQNTGYIVGHEGTILKTSDAGGNFIIGTSHINDLIPGCLKLSQNYPNPFNPSTTIKFDIPKSSHVKIVVYDMLGREIEQLINEERKPGSYEVTWDGSRFASGVYFYKIISDDFVETKKMLLLK